MIYLKPNVNREVVRYVHFAGDNSSFNYFFKKNLASGS